MSIRLSSSRRPKGIMPAPIIATSLISSSPFQTRNMFSNSIFVGNQDFFLSLSQQVWGDRTIPNDQARFGVEIQLSCQPVGACPAQLVLDVCLFQAVLDHPAPKADRPFRHAQ